DATSSGLVFDVLNRGSGLLGFQVLTNAPWLKVAMPVGVALGDDLGGDVGTVRLTVDTAGLTPGSYSGAVTVNSLYPAGTPHTFVVDLVVAEGAPTPTPVPIPATWADGNCSGAVDLSDALATMRHGAGLDMIAAGCPEMGSTVQVIGGSQHTWGDIDCSGEVNAIDALKILRFDAGLPSSPQANCPEMGAAIMIVPG
ncbi:MAG: hypothetical protein DRI30_00805, partial [Chloroflexi bacterium]